jgi:hypothetical protein
MFGLKFVGARGESEVRPYTSGGAIAVNDPVTIKTDGQVEKSAAGNPIHGIAETAVAGASLTVYVRVGSRMKVLMDNDNAGTAFAASHVGARFDIIGNSGAVQVDTSTVAQVGDGTDTGELLCLAYNPKGYGFDDDTSIGLFEIVEEQ